MTDGVIDWSNVKDSWPVKALVTPNEWSFDVLVAITGFLQRDPQTVDSPNGPAFIRIYTSLDLNEYVQVPTNLVRSISPYPYDPNTDNPTRRLTPVTIWLSRFSKVIHAQRNNDETVSRQENFLAGDIVDTYLPGVITEGLPLQRGANPAQVLESLVQRCSYGGCGSSSPGCCHL